MWQPIVNINQKQFGKFYVIKRCQGWQYVAQKSPGCSLLTDAMKSASALKQNSPELEKVRKKYQEPGTGRSQQHLNFSKQLFNGFGLYYYWIFKIFPLCTIILLCTVNSFERFFHTVPYYFTLYYYFALYYIQNFRVRWPLCIVWFCFELGGITKHLDWPHRKQWVFFPSNPQGLRETKTHCFPWGQSLSA